MQILFVTFSDIRICSSSNIRNISLIKGLLDIGNSVDIISYKTNNKAQVQDEIFKPVTDRCRVFEISGSLVSEKVSSGLLIKGSKNIKVRLYSLLRKLYYVLEPVDSMRKTALSLDIEGLGLGEYDLMISSSNPYSVHILAERIKKRYFKAGIKWVQYWGDALYFDTLIRHPIFPARLKKAEYNLIRNCDAVFYTNAVILGKQKELFRDMADKMTYIETPYAFAEKSEKAEFAYQVGYFGSFSTVVRDIMPLYSVLSEANYRSVMVMLKSIPQILLKCCPEQQYLLFENMKITQEYWLVFAINFRQIKKKLGLFPARHIIMAQQTKRFLLSVHLLMWRRFYESITDLCLYQTTRSR